MSKPKSENEEINRLITWVENNFVAKGELEKVVLREMSNIGSRPDRSQNDREVMIRDNGGTLQLVVRYDDELHEFNED